MGRDFREIVGFKMEELLTLVEMFMENGWSWKR